MKEGTDLYRFRNSNGELLYVGISLSAVGRAADHRRDQPWWDEVSSMTVEHLSVDRDGALAIEMYVIKTEMPKYNRSHNCAIEAIKTAASACDCIVCGERMMQMPVCMPCRIELSTRVSKAHWDQFFRSRDLERLSRPGPPAADDDLGNFIALFDFGLEAGGS